MGYEYYEISLKSGGGYVKPLAYLLDKLVGKNFRLPINYLADKRMVIFTGKGSQGKSKAPIWIKDDENGVTVWSNDDDPTQEPTETGFVKYRDYIKGC